MPRVGKVVELLIMALDKAAEGYMYLDDVYRHPSSVFYGSYKGPNSSVRVAVCRLQSRGLIEKSTQDEGKIVLKLTEAGRDWILKIKRDDDDNWDGIWRLVIFDIPESHRKVRDVFRNKLKSWGFKSWQKSVFSTKKPLTEELRKLASDLKIDKWVMVVESKNVGRD